MNKIKGIFPLSTAIVSSAIAFIPFAISPVQAANLLQNGSFENTNGTFVDDLRLNGMSLNPDSTNIQGWTTTNAELAWVNNVNASGPITTPFGSFFLDLTGYHDSSPYGGVTQTINTTVGQQYNLSFFLGASNPRFPGPISVTATAGFSNQTFTFNPSGLGDQWGGFNFDFTATSSSTPISIQGISTANQIYIGLDNVSVEPNTRAVPSPSSIFGIALASLGFGIVLNHKLAKANKKKLAI